MCFCSRALCSHARAFACVAVVGVRLTNGMVHHIWKQCLVARQQVLTSRTCPYAFWHVFPVLFEIDRERALLLTPNQTPLLSRPPRTRGEAPTAGPCRVTCPVTCPPAARNFPRAAAPRRASLGARGEGAAAETASNPTRSAAETDRARRTAAGTSGAAAAAGAATATSRRRRAGRKAAAGAAAAAGANLGAGTGGAAALAARGRGTRERSRRRRRRTSTTSGSPGNRCTKVTRRSAGLDRRRGRRGPRRTPEGDKLVLAAAGEEGGCDIGAEVYDRCCAVVCVGGSDGLVTVSWERSLSSVGF